MNGMAERDSGHVADEPSIARGGRLEASRRRCDQDSNPGRPSRSGYLWPVTVTGR
jgi:hypothetical protein